MVYHWSLIADIFDYFACGSLCLYVSSLLNRMEGVLGLVYFIIISGIGVYVIIRRFQSAPITVLFWKL